MSANLCQFHTYKGYLNLQLKYTNPEVLEASSEKLMILKIYIEQFQYLLVKYKLHDLNTKFFVIQTLSMI